MEKACEKYLAMKLPTQLIHADLHYDNVLCTEDKVSGLLDFEFAVVDWRAMELAVSLTKYAGEKLALVYFDEFISGFAAHGKLTESEMEAIPDLLILRVINNVVYFVGRALAKEDGIESLTTRCQSYATRIQWIISNKQNIIDMLKSKMLK
jgi:homoserine kinase type II